VPKHYLLVDSRRQLGIERWLSESFGLSLTSWLVKSIALHRGPVFLRKVDDWGPLKRPLFEIRIIDRALSR
jgi:hypothetical protein